MFRSNAVFANVLISLNFCNIEVMKSPILSNYDESNHPRDPLNGGQQQQRGDIADIKALRNHQLSDNLENIIHSAIGVLSPLHQRKGGNSCILLKRIIFAPQKYCKSAYKKLVAPWIVSSLCLLTLQSQASSLLVSDHIIPDVRSAPAPGQQQVATVPGLTSLMLFVPPLWRLSRHVDGVQQYLEFTDNIACKQKAVTKKDF